MCLGDAAHVLSSMEDTAGALKHAEEALEIWEEIQREKVAMDGSKGKKGKAEGEGGEDAEEAMIRGGLDKMTALKDKLKADQHG